MTAIILSTSSAQRSTASSKAFTATLPRPKRPCRLPVHQRPAQRRIISLLIPSPANLTSHVLHATGSDAVEVDIEEDTMERMEKTMEATRRSFGTVRTGRANPAALDRVMVDYYGAPTPLRQLAGISAPEASLLVVQPYDTSAIAVIEKAIMQSDLGLTPNNNGRLIRLQIPALTSDRRKEMTKIVAKLAEEGKVAIRNVRRDSMKAIEKREKESAIGEDERKDLEDAVQELTNEYVASIDALAKSKNEELTTV
ncbi:RRF1 [Auxenochlorella protothecoides x Auxenochlorella symbiontica]